MEFGPIDGLLIAASFIVAMGATMLGSTGGLLLAILATALPPPLVVPAHAVIEGARTGIGWAQLRRKVNLQIVIASGAGALVAIGLAAPFTRVVPDHVQAIILGAFLFWACWWPEPDPGKRFPYRLTLMGALTGALSVFLGDTVPLLRPFIADEPVDPAKVPPSVTAVAAVQHGFKVVAFALIGVDYLSLLPVLAAMAAATALGLLVGARLPMRLPPRMVMLGIRLVVSILAIRLVVVATGLF